MNFWKKLKKPFFILAPMADVTDMAFRQIIVETGKPDVLYTEFVSAAGLCSEKGRPKLLPHLKFKENERPIVAQIFGSVPKHFYECAKLVAELGFDGVDINMGCPASKIVKQNSGAGLILNPALAQEIISEAKRGAGKLPVAVKTRIGYNSIVTEKWISELIEAKPDAIIVHGRTMKEMSKVPAHWDEIEKAGKLCRKAGIPIIGNGDVMSYAEGVEKAKKYNLDGIMIGRGIFHNPWFFDPSIDPIDKTPAERIALLKKHINNFVELRGDSNGTNPAQSYSADRQYNRGRALGGASFDVMKRFIKIYINDFEGAKDLRNELMKIKSAPEILKKLESLALSRN